jgi:2-oxoglutarate dehydrogenase E2 component (dihydrolipoamide succinyltransferase)
MKTEMLMPQMGESIAEATIIRWHKNVGDTVKQDETILEISTDKVDSEIPSPASGVISEIKAESGATVPVQSVIAIIDSEGAGSGSSTPKPAETPRQPQQSEPQSQAPQQQAQASQPRQENTSQEIPSSIGNKVFSPLVRNIASQHGISQEELLEIPGSGAQGRVTKDDLLHYIDQKGSQSSAPSTPQKFQSDVQTAEYTPQVRPQPPAAQDFGPGSRVEPFDNMRKAIAEHMVRSKHTSPHVYSVAEIDMTAVSKWRAKFKNEFKAREGFSLSYMPFFLEAVTKALGAYPKINASVDGDNLVYKRDIHLGCAVALGEDGLGGLIVPNIKNAGSLNFVGIARGLQDIASRARSKKLSPQDVQGGTFTVTNIGGFGNIIGYPIISQPQLGILAIGAIKKRPVVIEDAIAVRDICYITLSYDHRVIDGALGGHFLKHITDYLQNWDMNRTL